MSKQKWEVKSHSSGPDITGEYDGYWEVVNEKGDGLRTSEDYEEIDTDLQKIADALNSFEGKLSVETALEINLHCDNELLKMEIERLKAENSKMRKALELAELELKAIYPRLGFRSSNVLDTVTKTLAEL